MARISILIMVFFVAMNAGAVMLDATGTDELMGIGSPSDDELTQVGGAEKVPTGTSSGGTNFAMFNVLGNKLTQLFKIAPGLNLLLRAGVPSHIVNFLGTTIGFVMTIDIIAFMRGYNL